MHRAAVSVAVATLLATACGAQPSQHAAPAPTTAWSSSAAPSAVAPAASPRAAAETAQLVRVRPSRAGNSYATVTAYDAVDGKWVRRFGPWTARIGANGFAPVGAKREGDGRTPSGTFGFASFFFGVAPRPSGISFQWRHAHTYDVWNDDPRSSRYNLWTDRRTQAAGRDPEPLHVRPAYDYAAVIGYNVARKPGLGSAIFLHVSHDSATSGCVSLSRARLLQVLRWLDPRRSPRIVMGTAG